MYEEKRAFPIKWVVIGVLILIVIIGLFVMSAVNTSKKNKAYDDLLARIKAAGVEYGRKNINRVKELEEECVTLEILIKEGYLESDSKDEPVLYNPKTKEKMGGDVSIQYDDISNDVIAGYQPNGGCFVDYEEKVKLLTYDITSYGFIAKLDAPEGLRLNTFVYKYNRNRQIDSVQTFEHDAPTYRFSELKTDSYDLVVTAKDYLGNEYERRTTVRLKKLEEPTIEYDAEVNDSKVVVNCPETEDKQITCSYTVDEGLSWVKSEKTTTEIEFEESGQIVVVVSDGTNNTDDVVQEVVVAPKCEDTEWSECTGCTAPCGQSCLGIQHSNCGTERACLYKAPDCEQPSSSSTSTTPEPPKPPKPDPVVTEFVVTVKASNGTPATQNANVVKGGSKTFTVKPNSGFVYSSVSCTSGTGVYSTKNQTLTVKSVSSARTCTVRFIKPTPPPTKYVVTFFGYTGNLLGTKTVDGGKTVSPMAAPAIAGYDFIGWTLNGRLFDFNTKIYSNTTLNASYKINGIKITFNTNGGTSIPNQYIPSGSRITRPEDPTKAAYRFNGWTLNGKKFDFTQAVYSSTTLNAEWLPIMIKTVSMPGTTEVVPVTLVNFTGIHQMTSNCTSGYTRSIKGNVIELKTNRAEKCQISILYY